MNVSSLAEHITFVGLLSVVGGSGLFALYVPRAEPWATVLGLSCIVAISFAVVFYGVIIFHLVVAVAERW